MGSETVADSNAMLDKMMSAMDGPGDKAKLSVAAAKAHKKAVLAVALEAKKLAAARKATAKVLPMKKPASKKPGKKAAAPVKKAAANRKVARKTMKAGKKR